MDDCFLFFYIWSMYTPSIPISILCTATSSSFPFSFMYIHPVRVFLTVEGCLLVLTAWLFTEWSTYSLFLIYYYRLVWLDMLVLDLGYLHIPTVPLLRTCTVSCLLLLIKRSRSCRALFSSTAKPTSCSFFRLVSLRYIPLPEEDLYNIQYRVLQSICSFDATANIE